MIQLSFGLLKIKFLFSDHDLIWNIDDLRSQPFVVLLGNKHMGQVLEIESTQLTITCLRILTKAFYLAMNFTSFQSSMQSFLSFRVVGLD